ncbi:MAG: ECF transporter S component [Lachnospiraceae bacterium]|nr:ECF transporter S component [Lachnospiraceae bacterium]
MKTKDITITALMAALVFVGTYFLKIPLPFGYTHLGDCLIILTVIIFGWKKGTVAGMIGAGLADLLGGYVSWVVPTAVIKGGWALIMGLIMYKAGKGKLVYGIIGAAAGGVFQIIGYTLVRVVLYGAAAAITALPILAGQTICGIVIGVVLAVVFDKAGVSKRLAAV